MLVFEQFLKSHSVPNDSFELFSLKTLIHSPSSPDFLVIAFIAPG